MHLLIIAITSGLLTLSAFRSATAGIGIGVRYSYAHTEGLEDNSGMFGGMIRLKHGVVGLEEAIEKRTDWWEGSDFEVVPVTLSVLVSPIPVAHALLGLGVYRTQTYFFSDFAPQTIHPIGFHFGAGIELPLLPRLKFAGDWRYRIVDYEFQERHEEQTDGPIHIINANGYSLSAGLILYP